MDVVSGNNHVTGSGLRGARSPSAKAQGSEVPLELSCCLFVGVITGRNNRTTVADDTNVCGVKRKVGWDVRRSCAVSFAMIIIAIIIIMVII